MSGCCAKEDEGAEYKVKGKFQLVTCNEDTEGEYSYGYTLSLTSELNGMGGLSHAPAALPPGMTRYPFYRTPGGSQEWSGQMRKISPPLGFDPRTL